MNKSMNCVKVNDDFITKENFESILKNKYPKWYEVYEWLDEDEQEKCLRNYMSLMDIDPNKKLKFWTQTDILINLNIFSKEEYAVVGGAIPDTRDEYDLFDAINSFPVGFEERVLIMICYLDYRWYVFPWEVINRIIAYFDKFVLENPGDKRTVLESVFIDCGYTHCPDETYCFDEDYFLIINPEAERALEEFFKNKEKNSSL